MLARHAALRAQILPGDSDQVIDPYLSSPATWTHLDEFLKTA